MHGYDEAGALQDWIAAVRSSANCSLNCTAAVTERRPRLNCTNREELHGTVNEDLFRLVDQIRIEDKYFDVSLSEIEEMLSAEGCSEWACEYYADGHDPVVLKFNLRTRRIDVPTAWTASLKLHGKPIDCIDWELRFRTADNSPVNESGWHRHLWDANVLSSTRCKRPVVDCDGGGLYIRHFVIRATSEMGILLQQEV